MKIDTLSYIIAIYFLFGDGILVIYLIIFASKGKWYTNIGCPVISALLIQQHLLVKNNSYCKAPMN